MSAFRAETPLGQEVQQLLLQEGAAGLNAAQIRRKLRALGRHVSEENLRELLRDGRVFVQRADGSYTLASAPAAGPSASMENAPAETNPPHTGPRWPQPLLANVPRAQRDYVVFDVETTGPTPSIALV